MSNVKMRPLEGDNMNRPTMLDFRHAFVPGRSARTLLLLHGTGGDETNLIPVGHVLDSEAALLSPRGKVLENGMPRFFRRLAVGIFDEEDLIRRTHELADFIELASENYRFDRQNLFAVGYSNGANIAASLLLLRPGALGGAALLRPMVPLVPEKLPDLRGVPVLIAAANHDTMVPPEEALRLAALLRNAGADPAVSFENVGHGLTDETIEIVKRWLTEIVR
jgi:predicted esterase